MNKSEHIEQLAQALCKAQAEFADVPLNSTNPFLGNKYADLGAVIKTAKPILAKHGLALSQLVIGNETSVGVTTLLMHQEGQWLETSMSLTLGDEKGKSRAQVAGSIVTYIRRYSYSAILGLATEEDTDGNERKDAKARQPAQPKTDAQRETITQYWRTQRGPLVAKVATIPYYGGVMQHVLASLTKLTVDGKIGSKMSDEQVLEVVNQHASRQADKASQEGSTKT